MSARRAVMLMTLLCVLAAATSADARKRRRKRKAPRAKPVASAQIEVPRYTVDRLADGMTLIHVPQKGLDVSVRLGVRAGSLHDPSHKAGVAWLLSRLVFDGSYDVKAGELPSRARELGGELDVQVNATWTMFSLDAPKEAFSELFEKQLLLVTNPMLQFADLDRARQAAVHADGDVGSGLRFAIDQLAFPQDNLGRRIAGTAKTRGAIELPDLLEFYSRFYAPSNAVVVVVGDVAIGDVRAVLDRAVLWPPVREPDHRLIGGEPNVPAEARNRARFSATAVGYHLGPVEQWQCDAVARVVELRALTLLRWEDQVATALEVQCLESRGHPFVAAFATGRSDAGGQMSELLSAAMERTARRPLRAEERAVIVARKASELALISAEPPRLADAVCRRALEAPAALREHIDAFWKAPRLRSKSLTKVMRRALKPDRRVVVQFSPFGG